MRCSKNAITRLEKKIFNAAETSQLLFLSYTINFKKILKIIH